MPKKQIRIFYQKMTVSLFRKMSVIEAEKTLTSSLIQPAIRGAHPLKHFSTSLEKVRAFRNKAITEPEVILEVKVDAQKYQELLSRAGMQQEGASKFPDAIQITNEGLTADEIKAGHLNIGIPPALLDDFNKTIRAINEVK